MLLIAVTVACGGKTNRAITAASPAPGSTAPASAKRAPGGIDGPGVGPGFAGCGVLAKAELCKCMVEDEPTVCDFVDDGKLPVHVLRAGNGQQTDTFLVVEQGDGLHAFAQLLYEQHHGKRDSNLTDPKLELRAIGGARVLRVEYGVAAETAYVNEQYDETLQGKAVKVCVLDGAPGAPSCPVSTLLSCTIERTDFAEPANPANTGKGSTSASVAIGDDGTVTVKKLAESGTPFDCAVTAETTRLLP